MSPRIENRSLARRHGWWVLLALCWINSTSLAGGYYVTEGIIEPAPVPYDEDAPYVLRSGPEEAILVALSDPRGLVTIAPSHRLRVLGEPTLERLANDLPLIEVVELQPPAWSFRQQALSLDSFALWAGRSSALYPSFPNESLARAVTVRSGGSSTPADSDGDGVSDTADAFPYDPTETRDSDRDGIGDNADPDDDNDGMPDTYEIQFGLNRLLKDSGFDLDSDGTTNGEEYQAGTAANLASSVFRVDELKLLDGLISIQFRSVAWRSYVLHTADQPAGPFLPTGEPILATNKITTVLILPNTELTGSFYELKVLPP